RGSHQFRCPVARRLQAVLATSLHPAHRITETLLRGRQSKLPGRRYGCNRTISPRSLLMSAATIPLPRADSTAAEQTFNFSQAHFAFRQLETFLTSDEALLASEAQVEEQLERRGRELLRLL